MSTVQVINCQAKLNEVVFIELLHYKQHRNKIQLPFLKRFLMRLKHYLEKLTRMDACIRRKSTGSPKEFAGRLDVSRATLFRYIQYLKDGGAPVKYCKYRESYIYESDFDFEIQKFIDPKKE